MYPMYPSATRYPPARLRPRLCLPSAQESCCQAHQHLVLPTFWFFTVEWLLGVRGSDLH